MQRVLAVLFIAWFRIGNANDLLDDPLTCVINEIEEKCFSDLHNAFVCNLDNGCEVDVDKTCGDFNDALECSANAADSNAVCSLKNPAEISGFQVWLHSLESLRDSVCSDGLINDLIRQEDNISCWDSDSFEGCIYNQLRIKHIAELLNPKLEITCFDLLISATSCGVLSMRRHGYCNQITDLPVHLVKRFFGKTPCGQSEWIWNTPYHVPNEDVKPFDAAALTEVTDGSESEVLPTRDTARLFGEGKNGLNLYTPTSGPVHNGVATTFSRSTFIISGVTFLFKTSFF